VSAPAGRRGLFITFEGIEGVGKSSQLAIARAALEGRGLRIVATREPGGTPLAERIRTLVLAPEAERVSPAAELLLMAAARAVHVASLIEPALARGDWVLCDRFTDATYAYQGGGRGIDEALIAPVAALASGGLEPDLTLLLDAPVALALARARGRPGTDDRIGSEASAFFERVRAAYLARANSAPARIRLIDAAGPPEDVAARVAALLPGVSA
jgi:dTMP kinase